MEVKRERFHPRLYTLLTGCDPGAETPSVDLLPGRFVARVRQNLDICRGDWPENPRELTCSVCGTKDIYDVGAVLVQGGEFDPNEPTFLGYFRCSSCGAGGPWISPDFPALSLDAIAQVLHASFGIVGSGGVGEVELFDGYRPKLGSDAEEHFLDLLAADPTNAQHFVRLGNVYVSGGRPDLAMAVVEHALELESDHIEALLVAGVILEKLDPQEAASYLRQAVMVAHSYRGMPHQQMRRILSRALQHLYRIHRESKGEIAFLPGATEIVASGLDGGMWEKIEITPLRLLLHEDDLNSFVPLANFLLNPERGLRLPNEPLGTFVASDAVPLRKAPGPGRNDPCPCGSGLKYKRCCGRDV